MTDDGTTADLLSDLDHSMDNIELGLPTSDVIHQLIAPHELQGLIDSSGR